MNGNGGFLKWVMGVFTVIIIAFGGWVFSSVSEVQLKAAVHESEMTRMRQDLSEIRDRLKVIEAQNAFIIQNMARRDGRETQ